MGENPDENIAVDFGLIAGIASIAFSGRIKANFPLGRKGRQMKKTIILMILAVLLAGCNSADWDRMLWGSKEKNFQDTTALWNFYQQQRLYNAMYDYYTQPYEVGGVLYVPAR